MWSPIVGIDGEAEKATELPMLGPRLDETQRICEPATVVQKQTRNPQRFRFGRVKSRLKNETARVGGHHRWPTLCMKLEPGIVPSQLKVYIISELDVTERAFSTYNDKARMWTQMDTEMVLALPVEEHHRLYTFTYKGHRFLVHTNIIRRRYSPLRQLGPSRDKVGTCEARRRNEYHSKVYMRTNGPDSRRCYRRTFPGIWTAIGRMHAAYFLTS